ncbi:hypothetical protein, partial [Kerstersia sp.]|uniref:hypothetical protein n=1 Tax=Kerstersia sp. TaxID=1930783 RepID=UPI003F93787A
MAWVVFIVIAVITQEVTEDDMTMRNRATGPFSGPRQQNAISSKQNILTMRTSVAAVLTAC